MLLIENNQNIRPANINYW